MKAAPSIRAAGGAAGSCGGSAAFRKTHDDLRRDLAVIKRELGIHRWIFGLFCGLQIVTLVAVLLPTR
jgi:hypothetical protein